MVLRDEEPDRAASDMLEKPDPKPWQVPGVERGLALDALPRHHGDPFDRWLLLQAPTEAGPLRIKGASARLSLLAFRQ